MSPADLADLRRQTPKQQNSLNFKQSVFLCEIIQLAAFPLRDLRNLRENNTQEYPSYIAQTKPQYLPQISQIYADEPPNSNNRMNHINMSFSAK